MSFSNKQLYIVLAILIVAIGGYVVWQNIRTRPITNQDSQGTDIIAFGDSLVYGVGSTNKGDFVSLLSGAIGEPIINLGHSGDTTQDGLDRINDIFQYNPRIVIVLLGGNDFLRKVPMETTFANLENIITTIQSHGAAVLLLGVRGGLLYDSYDSHYEDLARKLHTGYVPNVLDGLLGDMRVMSDAIHPNNDGYKLVAAKVLPELRRMLK